MNIAQLRTFITVVEHGSFSEAARVMGISQPAVTMQIQSLESEVNATLLDRRYRGVDLTEAGRALLPHAKLVLQQIEEAHESIASLSGTISGRLTIAASTTPGVYVIPRLLGSFLRDHPEVGVNIVVRDTSEVVELIESGKAQIGVTGAVVRGARAQFDQLGNDELVLIAGADSAIAQAKSPTVEDLAAEAWVARELGSGTRQSAERVLQDLGLDPQELRVAVELGTGEAVVNAVEGGLGIAIVSRYVAEKALSLGSVAEVAVAGFPANRPMYLCSPKGSLTRAATAFSEHLRSAIEAPSAG